jgi:hypothetical protein
VTEGYWRIGFRFGFYGWNERVFQWYKGANLLGSLRIDQTSHKLKLYVSNTLVATGTIEILAGSFYSFEIHVKIDNTNGVLETRIDGVPDVSYSGDTQPGSDTTIDRLYYADGGGATTIYLDDLAMNDTTGSVDNSWCGDGHIVRLKPNMAGDVTMLTPSSGSDNWDMVDEVPHDADASYVESSGSGDYDLYNLTASGLSNVAILRTWVEARARDLVAEGANLAFVLKTEGSEFTGSNHALLTSYGRIVGDERRKNPQTDADWTVGELDAAQVGPKVM